MGGGATCTDTAPLSLTFLRKKPEATNISRSCNWLGRPPSRLNKLSGFATLAHQLISLRVAQATGIAPLQNMY